MGWLNEQQDPKYHQPTEYCSGTSSLWINILSPGDKSRVNTNDVEVRIEVLDNYKVTQVEVYVDESLKTVLNNEPWTVTLTVPDGVHRIGVKAKDEKGFDGSRFVDIGVNQDWQSPTPAP